MKNTILKIQEWRPTDKKIRRHINKKKIHERLPLPLYVKLSIKKLPTLKNSGKTPKIHVGLYKTIRHIVKYLKCMFVCLFFFYFYSEF